MPSPDPGVSARIRRVALVMLPLVLARLLVLLTVSPSAFAEPARHADPASSVLTVDQLLRLENERAREVVRKAREGLAPGVPRHEASQFTEAPAPAVGPSITVESLTRLGDEAVRLVLWVDGRRIDRATLGTRVGRCEIVRVAGACVHLAPAEQKRRGTGVTCPTACWTGAPLPPAQGAGPVPVGIHDGRWGAAAPSAFALPPTGPSSASSPRSLREPMTGAPGGELPARPQ